ncbi:unnamed protein product [Brachionus calyciflorus]|uniref:Uncharacterized protein n=1 Tax=Brachionus calyciflorus TaxID=104777 RepID=A0A814AC44_9BILA|nr:unnamed protein product [Brachionus calyciflorus]
MSYQSDFDYQTNEKYFKAKKQIGNAQSYTRDEENIQEIRKLIREQSNMTSKSVSRLRSHSDSSDEIEVPVKRFPPLPDIPRSDDPFYRTESKLIKDRIDQNLDNNNNSNSFTMEVSDYKYSNNKKDTLYHFASSSSNKINHRLPSIENHSLQNAMDLDEDLPISNESTRINQRLIYTSPGDRIISPIKRPQAPSPPSSAHRKKSNQNSDTDSDNDLIIS